MAVLIVTDTVLECFNYWSQVSVPLNYQIQLSFQFLRQALVVQHLNIRHEVFSQLFIQVILILEDA